MFRSILASAAAVGLVFAASGSAEEIKGKLKSVDAKKNSITLTVDNKDKSFDCVKDASVVSQTTGGKKKAAKIDPIAGGLAGLKAGAQITLLTESKDGKEVVTSIKVDNASAAEKADKDPVAKNKKKKKKGNQNRPAKKAATQATST